MKAGWGLGTRLGFERKVPSELAKLEQLHVESNSEHSQTSLHLSSTLKLTLHTHTHTHTCCSGHMYACSACEAQSRQIHIPSTYPLLAHSIQEYKPRVKY